MMSLRCARARPAWRPHPGSLREPPLSANGEGKKPLPVSLLSAGLSATFHRAPRWAPPRRGCASAPWPGPAQRPRWECAEVGFLSPSSTHPVRCHTLPVADPRESARLPPQPDAPLHNKNPRRSGQLRAAGGISALRTGDSGAPPTGPTRPMCLVTAIPARGASAVPTSHPASASDGIPSRVLPGGPAPFAERSRPAGPG